MAAVFKVSCGSCGDVHLPARSITLAVWPQSPELSTFSFLCPRCGLIETRPVDGTKYWLLRTGGVQPKELRLPERSARLEDVAPLSSNDLLDASLTLRETDLLIELLEEADGDHAEEG